MPIINEKDEVSASRMFLQYLAQWLNGELSSLNNIHPIPRLAKNRGHHTEIMITNYEIKIH